MDWISGFFYSAQALTSATATDLPIVDIVETPYVNLPTKAITLDGGGIRGLYSVKLMQAIEDRLNGSVSDKAQVLAGSSTGSILAFGLATMKTLDDIETLYKTKGSDIFYETSWEYIEEGNGIWGPKYDPSKFEALLKDNFGDAKLSAIKEHQVLAYSTNITDQTVKIFDTKQAQADPSQDEPIWFAVRSSTAAPTYFPSTKWQDKALADGGLIVNNPSTITAIELKKRYGWDVLKNLKLISIGTGTYSTGIPYETATHMGELQWAIPISDMIMKSTSNLYEHLSQDLLSPEQTVRVNGLLATDISLDNYSPQNLLAIEMAALTYIKNHPQQIDTAAKMLEQ